MVSDLSVVSDRALKAGAGACHGGMAAMFLGCLYAVDVAGMFTALIVSIFITLAVDIVRQLR